MKETQDISQHLLQHGIRPSLQRIAIVDYLFKNHTHPTADEIYATLQPGMPTLSKTTVYNTLKLLADHGVALCLTIDEKNTRFDGNTHPHAHFKCKHCGKIIDIMNYELPTPPQGDFDVEETALFLFGKCSECKN